METLKKTLRYLAIKAYCIRLRFTLLKSSKHNGLTCFFVVLRLVLKRVRLYSLDYKLFTSFFFLNSCLIHAA